MKLPILESLITGEHHRDLILINHAEAAVDGEQIRSGTDPPCRCRLADHAVSGMR